VKPKDPKKEKMIADAAVKLVARNGLAGLTMAAIAKATGLGMGTVYTYFKSKEELVNHVYRTIKVENTNRILAVVKDQEPFAVLLRKVWISYIQNRILFYEEHFFIDQCTNSHFLDAASRKTEKETYGAFHRVLQLGKDQLLVKEIDDALLTAHLMGSVNEIANLVRQQGRKLDAGLIDTGFALAWDSIKR